ncbi:hypothetical protein [Paenibacillus sp. CAA11]|uniref:hypothetical protein n=1 Tax=Paenibacillus sp. CAA11 TaxID=1532905 RepID=UPI001F379891|nr:hypothetical protein [Paenibacillus sp. CAA11]
MTAKVQQKNASSPVSPNLLIDEQKNGEIGMFHLGMTLDEVRGRLAEKKVEITNETENASEPGAEDQGERSVWTEGASFTFNNKEELYSVDVLDEQPTSLGLRKGDAKEQVMKLYGKDFTKFEALDDDGADDVLEYTLDGRYFTVTLKGDQVLNWGVSTRSYQTLVDAEAKHNQEGSPLKEQLMTDLKAQLSKLSSHPKDLTAAVMVADRVRGLQNITSIDLSEEEIDYVIKAGKKAEGLLTDSVIYSGYSAGGIHFIAILSPRSAENTSFKQTINQVRDSQDEFDFLTAIVDASDTRSLQMGLDVYAEDLNGKLKNIPIGKLTVKDEDSSEEFALFEEKYSQDLLKSHKRSQGNGKSIPSGTWHTYMFDGTLLNELSISIETGTDLVVLQNK